MNEELTGEDYWEVIAELDYLHYLLAEQQQKIAQRPPMVAMVDAGTGYDKQLLEDFKTVVGRIKELQAMLPPDDPHFLSSLPSHT